MRDDSPLGDVGELMPLAQHLMNLFTALRIEGFTEEQAMQLVCANLTQLVGARL